VVFCIDFLTLGQQLFPKFDPSSEEVDGTQNVKLVVYLVSGDNPISDNWLDFMLSLRNLEAPAPSEEFALSFDKNGVFVQFLPDALISSVYSSFGGASEILKQISFSVYTKSGSEASSIMLSPHGVTLSPYSAFFILGADRLHLNGNDHQHVAKLHVSYRVMDVDFVVSNTLDNQSKYCSRAIAASAVDSQGETFQSSTLFFSSDSKWDSITFEIWHSVIDPILAKWRGEKNDDLVTQVIIYKLGEMVSSEKAGELLFFALTFDNRGFSMGTAVL
jgi:hypothetical protein